VQLTALRGDAAPGGFHRHRVHSAVVPRAICAIATSVICSATFRFATTRPRHVSSARFAAPGRLLRYPPMARLASFELDHTAAFADVGASTMDAQGSCAQPAKGLRCQRRATGFDA
jgi:hypothetical protein